MNGRIKMYDANKGFGFILGSDNSEYFFHISHVENQQEVKKGMKVTFRPTRTLRGEGAVSIHIDSNNYKTKPTFIVVGDTRIKLSNIKEYGISSGTLYFYKEMVEDPDAEGFIAFLIGGRKATGRLIEISREDYNDDREYLGEEKLAKKVNYLYITTYQGQNYTFYETHCNFNIYSKCEELDNYFL